MDERVHRRVAFLTADELVERASSVGIPLSPRTVSYYVSVGILPQPQRAPFEGADGRVRYFPADALQRLKRVHTLKEQGFKLEQIQKMLEGPSAVEPGDRSRRLIRALASDELRRLESELRARLASGTEDPAEAVKAYYTHLLQAVYRDEDPVPAIDHFLRTATRRERERLLLPLMPRAAMPVTQQKTPGIFRLARAIAGALAVRRRDSDEVVRLLDSAEAHVRRVRERNVGLRPNAVEEEIRRNLVRGLDLYLEAFHQLRANLDHRDRDSVKDALDKAQRARDLLEALEDVVRARLKLAELLPPPEPMSEGGE